MNYFNRQRETFGFMLSRSFADSANQAFFYRHGRVERAGNKYLFDLSEVEECGFELLKREFFVSIKRGIVPEKVVGGEISLYEEHIEFNTYKIAHTDTRVELLISEK